MRLLRCCRELRLRQEWLLSGNWLTLAILLNSYQQCCPQFPTPCTDLNPLFLLHYLAPTPHKLPPGVEIIYDAAYNVHAYRLTPRASTLSFPARALTTACQYFPEEFSLLVTLKPGPRTPLRDECLFALIPRGTTSVKIGVRIYKGTLHIDYWDRVRSQRRVTEVKHVRLTEPTWRTVIVSVTGERVSVRTDCGKQSTQRLKREFPALISAYGDNIHIGNCNNEKRGLFTGEIKEMILLAGADLSIMACPSQPPLLPDIRPPYTPPPVPYPPYPQDITCTWRDTGRMSFDVYNKRVQVCYSGVWQPVLLQKDEPSTKRMDYIVWHQDIVTAAPTIDIEIFRIPEEGLFMATASFDIRDLKKQQSAIFKWEGGKFKVYQSLYTLGAQAWDFFQIGKKFFLAVANHGARRDKPSKSVIYIWNRKRKRFKLYQEIVTWTARDLEYFQIEDKHFLAVANHVRGQNHTINSVIYQWSKMEKKFKEVQQIETIGAYDWTHFLVDGYNFLAVANSYSGPPDGTTRLRSVIYFWQSGRFLPFQAMETTGATDWEFFRIHDEFFLVVANAYNYGPHTTDATERYRTNSTIYRLNTVSKQFEVYQQIITYSAVDWESFQIDDNHYLIVSNAQHDGATVHEDSLPLPLERTRSVIYRWQGVEKFVPVHHLDTLPSADWETFVADGDTYLVYANADDNISQVYKVKIY